MSPQTRRLLLFAAAAVTVLAVIFAPSPEEPVQPLHTAAISRPRESPTPAPPTAELTPSTRTGLKQEPNELFLVDKPPPPPKPAADRIHLPAPVAPPLPYAYMGKMVDNGKLTVFLTREDRPYVVHAGDVLDSQYRVDAIRPPQIELTYLPLKQKQLLHMGENK